MNHHLEAKRAAQLAQLADPPFGTVTKAEVRSLMNLDRLQRIMNDRGDEFRGAHARKLRGEREHQYRVDPGLSQQLEPRLQRCNQFGAGLRTQKTQRVRIKCNRYGTQRTHGGALPEPVKNEPMAKMDAVEIPNAHHGGPQALGKTVELAKNLHVRSRREYATRRMRAECAGGVLCWFRRGTDRATC